MSSHPNHQNQRFILSAATMDMTLPTSPQCPPPASSGGNIPHNVTSSNVDSAAVAQCSHHSHTAKAAPQFSTENYKQQLQKYQDEALSGGDIAKFNGILNEIFVKRLQDIDCNAGGDVDLKLATYQEWVEMLLQNNAVIIRNMEDLELEVSERLELVQRKVNANCRHSQGNELNKCRKDIAMLLKVIQNAYHNDNWNLKYLRFETLTHSQVLGLSDQEQCIEAEGSSVQPTINDDAAQKNKLISNMKALAVEVADKHDEVLDLKKQILCMEDEIQKAQKKIQLKDDVIKELRNDLKCVSATKVCDTTVDMPPVNSETQRSATTQASEQSMYLNSEGSQLESLSHSVHLEHQTLKVLEKELNELFEINRDWKKHDWECHRKRLSDIFQKSEAEKTEAYRKLDFIRQQLIDIETTSGDSIVRYTTECDSGFSSKSENDQDAKILEALRQRLCKLNECSFELKKRVQKLEFENNDLTVNLAAEKTIVQRNSRTLKEVADLLCGMTGQQLCYDDIYKVQCTENPFCDAILKMKQSFRECEKILLHDLFDKSEKIEQLESSGLECEAHKVVTSATVTKTTPMTPQRDTSQLQQQRQQTPPQQQKPQQQQPVDNHNCSDKDSDSFWNW